MNAERMCAIDTARAHVVTAACAWRDVQRHDTDQSGAAVERVYAQLSAAVDRLRAIVNPRRHQGERVE